MALPEASTITWLSRSPIESHRKLSISSERHCSGRSWTGWGSDAQCDTGRLVYLLDVLHGGYTTSTVRPVQLYRLKPFFAAMWLVGFSANAILKLGMQIRFRSVPVHLGVVRYISQLEQLPTLIHILFMLFVSNAETVSSYPSVFIKTGACWWERWSATSQEEA